jgi:uncharacterized protein YcfJ
VEPVTATLPVVPDTVHSGVPAFCGGAVGHELDAGAGPAVDVATSAIEGEVLADDVDEDVVSDPHAATVRTNDAAHAASTADDMREEFTVANAMAPHCDTAFRV